MSKEVSPRLVVLLAVFAVLVGGALAFSAFDVNEPVFWFGAGMATLGLVLLSLKKYRMIAWDFSDWFN